MLTILSYATMRPMPLILQLSLEGSENRTLAAQQSMLDMIKRASGVSGVQSILFISRQYLTDTGDVAIFCPGYSHFMPTRPVRVKSISLVSLFLSILVFFLKGKENMQRKWF